MKRLLPIAIVLFGAALTGFTPASSESGRTESNASQLRTGRFTYRTLLQNKDAGTSEISIRADSSRGAFIYSNHVTGQFSQQWEAIAYADFTPISANLSFGDGRMLHPVFELKYESGRVTGFVVPRHPDTAGKRNVALKILPDTVDQRIDWAAAISQKHLVPEHEFGFHVFDPGSGNSRVTARVVGPEEVRVPAGTFQAIRIIYTIEKSGGKEVYQVLTNVDGPRMLLKEEFPNGAVTELVKVLD
jgi:hypothetical protein